MNRSLTIFAQSNDRRRGACPTLDQPMRTGDGLLARARLHQRKLTPKQIIELARLAQAHGNGIVEVTARGNLQVRGLTDTSAPRFADAVSAAFDIDRGLVIDLSPIAGEDPSEKADPRSLATAIAAGASSISGQLGPKVSVVIDGGGQIGLSALKTDIRLLALDDTRWAVTLGGGKAQIMDREGAVSATLAVLAALAALGQDARATDLFAGQTPSHDALPNLGPFALRGGQSHPLALPFGQIDAQALIAFASAAEATGVEIIRLAPDHILLVDGAPPALLAHAAELGFIIAADDPRLHVSACIGSDGCVSGQIPARDIAGQLAANVPRGEHLHVSGCSKGCAHPTPSDLTLVGREDGIGLVRNGRAGDTPEHIMTLADLTSVGFGKRDDAI